MAVKNATKTAIESLAYRAKGPSRQVLWDAKVRGFGVRVTPEGGKQFIIFYRVNGRQRLMSLGPIDHFRSLDDARTGAGDLLNGLRTDGTDPMAQRERMANADSMTELWKGYERDHLSHMAANAQKNVTSTSITHIEKDVGKLSPSQITKADVIRLHDHATRNGGKVVANRCVQRLHAMLQWLFDRNERECPVGWRNPAIGLKLHRELPRTAILDFSAAAPNRSLGL
jgi:Arm DNA-binding domain